MYLKLLLSLFVLFVWNVVSSATDYNFRHYTNEQGLSHNAVYCITQDQDGFMWFGTKDGLNRFDGHRFTIFQSQHVAHGIMKSNCIRSLCTDHEGVIWIGSSRGIFYYDPKTARFGTIDSLIHFDVDINAIVEDGQHNIWFQSVDGLIRYNKGKNTVVFYNPQSNFIPLNITSTQTGDVWVSSPGAIYKYNSKYDHFDKFDFPMHSGSLPIADAGARGLMVGTEDSGFLFFNPYRNTITPIQSHDNKNQAIHVKHIIRYAQDEYWIASESGLYIYNAESQQLENFQKDKHDPHSVADNAVYSLFKDREQGVWLGSFYRGISYWSKTSAAFEDIVDQKKEGGIQGDVIREIHQDQTGDLWIGTEDHGLNKWDSKTNVFTNYNSTSTLGRITSNNVQGLLVERDQVWIGLFNAGIEVLDINTQKVIKHYAPETQCGLDEACVVKIVRLTDGTLLVGTSNGLFKYLLDTDRFERVKDLAESSSIQCLYEDHNHTLWVGTFGNGLFSRTKDGLITHYAPKNFDTTTPGIQFITDLFEDSNNQLWVATQGSGLLKYQADQQIFNPVSIKKGGTYNFIYKILEGKHNQLWITTSKGLFSFNTATSTSKQYTKSDGVTNNQFNYNSGYKDAFGILYLGTIDGMTIVRPERLVENSRSANLCITGFQVLGHAFEPQNQSITHTQQVDLQYNQSSFVIDFTLLSYSSLATTEYEYKLDGFDKQWTSTEYNNARYTNLKPGKYVFRVRANHKDMLEKNSNERDLVILIQAPWWKTYMAYGCYFLALSALFFFVYQVYKTRKRSYEAAQAAKEESTKSEEILNAKIDFFTQVAHEIRTPLTLIKGSIDRIGKPDQAHGSIEKNLPILDKNTTRLLNLTNQLLDFQKTEQEGMKLCYETININTLISEISLLFSPLSLSQEVHLILHLPPEPLSIMADREALTKILSNLFSNALKYGERRVDVYARLQADNHSVVITVNSDGATIPKAMSEKIFEAFFQYKDPAISVNPKGTGIGLFLARSLAQLHQGTLVIDIDAQPLNSLVLTLPQSHSQSNSQPQPPTVVREVHEVQAPAWVADTPKIMDPSPNLSHRLTVLVVEDEKEMLQFIAEELEREYDIITAENGALALDLLQHHVVHLIISDVMMPIMDGFEFCRKVKSQVKYQHIPVILLTAKQNTQAQIEGLEIGADAYIGKPFTTVYLMAQMTNLLKKKDYLIEAFSHLPFVPTSQTKLSQGDEDFVCKFNELIQDSLSDPSLGVDALTAAMGISASSLYRKVKTLCNTNPNEYIRTFRLKKAAEYLIVQQKSIKEVAYLTGFSSPSYFTSCFFKHFGMNPSDFIRQNQKQR